MHFWFFGRETRCEGPKKADVEPTRDKKNKANIDRLMAEGDAKAEKLRNRGDYDPSTNCLHPEYYEHIEKTGVAPLFNHYGPQVKLSLDCSMCSYYSYKKTTIEKNRGANEVKYDVRCEHPKGQGEIKTSSVVTSESPKWCPYAAEYIKHKSKGYEVDSESSSI